MDENKKKILQMLAEGKITVDETAQLLTLLGDENTTHNIEQEKNSSKPNPKYLYVKVEPKEGHQKQSTWGEGRRETERVNIRVPISLIRSGMKLTALMPPKVAEDINRSLNEKGIGFNIRNLKDDYIEPLIDALNDTEIEVDNDEALIKIYAR